MVTKGDLTALLPTVVREKYNCVTRILALNGGLLPVPGHPSDSQVRVLAQSALLNVLRVGRAGIAFLRELQVVCADSEASICEVAFIADPLIFLTLAVRMDDSSLWASGVKLFELLSVD